MNGTGRIAVMTGATSFVGAAVLKELLKAGFYVYAVVRPESKKLDKLMIRDKILTDHMTVLERDLGDLEALPEDVKKADVFLHFAWGGSGSESRKDALLQAFNVESSLAAVKAAAQMGCRRFIFSGSQAEYGFHRERMTEESVCAPASAYGSAKLETGERAAAMCRELGMDFGHLRIFSAYGPGDHPWSLVSDCVRTFLSGGEMRMGSCDQMWNFLYIEDLAKAVAAMALHQGALMGDTDESSIYNLAGGPEDTRVLRTFVEEIHRACGGQGSCVYGVRPPNAEGVVSLDPDISRISRVTGWKPEVRFEEGIRRIIANT